MAKEKLKDEAEEESEETLIIEEKKDKEPLLNSVEKQTGIFLNDNEIKYMDAGL